MWQTYIVHMLGSENNVNLTWWLTSYDGGKMHVSPLETSLWVSVNITPQQEFSLRHNTTA